MAICHFCLSQVDVKAEYMCCIAISCSSFLVFQPYQWHTTRLRWMNRAACRCNPSCDSVILIYGCATWTSVTKFPRKPGKPRMHEEWIPGAPLWFLRVPGIEASNHSNTHNYQCSFVPRLVQKAEKVLVTLGTFSKSVYCTKGLHLYWMHSKSWGR